MSRTGETAPPVPSELDAHQRSPSKTIDVANDWFTASDDMDEEKVGLRSPPVQSNRNHNDACQPLEGPTVRSNYGNQRAHSPCGTETAERCPLKAEMVSRSVYREDFQAWDSPPKIHPFRPCDNLKVNREIFANTTTNRDSFCHRSTPVTVRESCKPAPPAREVLPFDGTTNYRSQYLSHPVQPRRPNARPVYQPAGAPLARLYTSHQDFRGQQSEMARSFKPTAAWEKNPAAFEGTTEFTAQFKAWPPQPRFQPKTKEYSAPSGDMAHLSTTRADFGEHRGFRRPEAVRPAHETRARPPAEAPMKSTMKEDFKAWATARRVPVASQLQEMERPKGPFAKMTTARSSYTPKVAQCAVSCKPRPKPLNSGPLMERDSVYRSSFTARPAPRCRVQDGGGTPPGFRYHSVDPEGHRLYGAAPANMGVAEPGYGADEESSPLSQGGGGCGLLVSGGHGQVAEVGAIANVDRAWSTSGLGSGNIRLSTDAINNKSA
ncbi:unnamed protein product [Lota lota]